jgi:hypothetical protein
MPKKLFVYPKYCSNRRRRFESAYLYGYRGVFTKRYSIKIPDKMNRFMFDTFGVIHYHAEHSIKPNDSWKRANKRMKAHFPMFKFQNYDF